MAALVVGLRLPLPASAQAQADNQRAGQAQKLPADEQRFMKSMGEANLAEVETGKLAETRGQEQKVKEFGAMMVRDHTRSLQQLQTLATRKGVELPGSPGPRHAKAAKAVKALAESRGEDFDRRYSIMAAADHKDTLALLKKVQGSAKDEDLRNLANEMIPVVAGHLAEAQKLLSGK